MSRSTPALPAEAMGRQAGFTLLELLIASAITLVILGAASSMLMTTARVQTLEQERVPLQATIRSSLEVMALDLRRASDPRVLYSAANVPNDLKSVVSTNSVLTLTVTDAEGYFTIPEPGGYPNSKSFSQNSVTDVNSPNSERKFCDEVFKGNDWALVTVGSQAPRWVQTHQSNPCTGNDKNRTPEAPGNIKLNHNQYPLSGMTWAPDGAISKVWVIQYYIGTETIGGQSVPTLFRRTDSQAPQVVAYHISGMRLEYSVDGVTFTTTPSAIPNVVRVTLTGQEARAQSGGTRRTYALTNTVFMRKATQNAAP